MGRVCLRTYLRSEGASLVESDSSTFDSEPAISFVPVILNSMNSVSIESLFLVPGEREDLSYYFWEKESVQVIEVARALIYHIVPLRFPVASTHSPRSVLVVREHEASIPRSCQRRFDWFTSSPKGAWTNTETKVTDSQWTLSGLSMDSPWTLRFSSSISHLPLFPVDLLSLLATTHRSISCMALRGASDRTRLSFSTSAALSNVESSLV